MSITHYVCRVCFAGWFLGATPDRPPETITAEELCKRNYAYDTREKCATHAEKEHNRTDDFVVLVVSLV